MSTQVLPTRSAGEALLNVLSAEPAKKKAPPRGQLTTWPAIKEYIFAGKAVFTLHNPKTGVRLTYKVTVKKEDVKAVETAWQAAAHAAEHGQELDYDTECCLQDSYITYFVNLLHGPDNTADFTYLGVLRKPGNFFITTKSQVTRRPTSFKALVWFLDAMRCEREILGGKPLEFWHNGHCGCCGRMLTVPKSVADGIGPECAKRRAS